MSLNWGFTWDDRWIRLSTWNSGIDTQKESVGFPWDWRSRMCRFFAPLPGVFNQLQSATSIKQSRHAPHFSEAQVLDGRFATSCPESLTASLESA
jgi:hypothetical protein